MPFLNACAPICVGCVENEGHSKKTDGRVLNRLLCRQEGAFHRNQKQEPDDFFLKNSGQEPIDFRQNKKGAEGSVEYLARRKQ